MYKTVNGQQVELSQLEIDEYNARQPSQSDLLGSLKETKIRELTSYHYGDVARTMTINNSISFSLLQESRDLVVEQVNFLEEKIKLGDLLEENAYFNYISPVGIIPLSLTNLMRIHSKMMDIVNANYVVYIGHQTNINNLENDQEVADYDFTIGYLVNQNINLI